MKVVLLFIFAISISAKASNQDSAVRDPSVPVSHYFQQALASLPSGLQGDAVIEQALYSESDELPAATDWTGLNLQRLFERMRDERFLSWEKKPSFQRRSTWLFPDDGCYARATMANRNFLKWKVPPPKKVFAFGKLRLATQNHPRGSVYWWYHVAPIVEVKRVKYVLDPSVDPKKPLTLKSWLNRIGSSGDLRVTICESGAYSVRTSCSRKIRGNESEASQKYYLDKEWDRLKVLGRNPERELGKSPPW